jgi:YD repeat-containing protein
MRKFYAKALASCLLFIWIIAPQFVKAQQSLYTGQIPIGIPLHTVSAGNVSVPIGLNYDMSGVKVNSHSGWVGSNWNLQAGGMIVRQLRDLPDEVQNGESIGWLNSRDVYNESWSLTNRAGINSFLDIVDASYNRSTGYNKRDSEPDEFNFQLPNGQSGKFFLNELGNWVFQGSKLLKVKDVILDKTPFADIPIQQHQCVISDTRIDLRDVLYSYGESVLTKIWTYPSVLLGFTLVSEDGTQYVFGGNTKKVVYSIPMFNQHSNIWLSNVWYLSEIISTDGKKITFSYDEYHDIRKGTDVGGKFLPSMDLNASQIDIDKTYTGGRAFNDTSATINSKKIYNGNLIRPVYLTKIESPTDSVVFRKSRSFELDIPTWVFENEFSKIDIPPARCPYIDGNGNQKFYNEEVAQFKKDVYINQGWSPYTSNNQVCISCLSNDPKDKFISNFAYPKLDSIIVYAKQNGGDGFQLKKRFNLRFNNSGLDYTYNSFGSKLQRVGNSTNRLRLEKISTISNNDELLSHSLEYNDNVSLPIYFDKEGKIDHWGLFNGKKFILENVKYVGEYKNYFKSREPSINLDTVQAGILKAVILPTGGKTQYAFELNETGRTYHWYTDFPDFRGSNLNYNISETPIVFNSKKFSEFSPVFEKKNTGLHYNFSNGFLKTGGLRIKSVSNLDIDLTTLGKKDFLYNTTNEISNQPISSGIYDDRLAYYYPYIQCNNAFKYNPSDWSRRDRNSTPYFYSFGYRLFNTSSVIGMPITYSNVTIKELDGSISKLTFTNFDSDKTSKATFLDYYDNDFTLSKNGSNPVYNISIVPGQSYNDLSLLRGNIIKSELFNNNSIKVSEQIYTFSRDTSYVKTLGVSTIYRDAYSYSILNEWKLLIWAVSTIASFGALEGIQGVAQFDKLKDVASNVSSVGSIFDTNTDVYMANFINRRKLYYGSYLPIKVESIAYDINTPTTSLLTTKYLRYNSFLQLAADSTVLPNNTWIANRYKYVSDITYPNVPAGPDVISVYNMSLRNMLSYPIEIQTIKNGKTIGANLNFYKRNLDAGGNIKSIKLDRTLSLKHDDLSALASITNIGEYNFIYPTSRYITTTNNLAYDASGNLTSANDRSGLTSKIEYNGFHLPIKKYIAQDQAKTETNYEYELLRGVTKVTDANAQKIHYQYDDFNRLKKVKDNDNATVLKVYQYGTQTSINPSTSTFLSEAECKINSSPCDLAAYAASDSSTITCDSTTSKIVLNGWGSTDSTDVRYTWTGPNGYSSRDLNPEPIKVTGDPIDYAGKYLLTVTRDGCTEPDTMSTDVNIQCNGCTKQNSNFKISGKVYPSVVSTCGIVNLTSFCDGCSTTAGPPPNLITNGDFTNGNTGFSSDFSFNNGWNLQYRSYKLDDKTNTWEWFPACGSRPAETSGNMMIGYGGGTQRFWYQNITTIQPNTDHKFTYWAVNLGQNIDLKVTVNGVQVGTSTILSTANADCSWKQITVTWNSGSATSAVFAIVNNKDSGAGNGFALDNITLTAVPKDVKWTGPNGFVSFDKNPTKVKTPTVAGTYYYTLEMKNDTCIRRFRVPVTVKACATSNCPVVCTGSTADLSISEFYSDQTVLEASEATRVVVRIKNSGPNSATNVKIKFFLPLGSSCDGILSTQGSYITQKDTKGNTVVTLSPSNSIANGANDHFFISFKADIRKRFAIKAEIFSTTECDPNSPHGNGYTNGEDDEGLLMINDNICDNFKAIARVNGSTISTEQACKSTITLSTICNDCISNTGDAATSSCIGDIGATGSTRKDGDIIEVFNNGTFGAYNTGFSSDMTYNSGGNYQPNTFKIAQSTDSYQYLGWCPPASDDRLRLPPLFLAYGGASAGTKVWYQTVPKLLKNTDYTFSFIATPMSSNTNIVFKLMVKSNATGSVFVDVPGATYAISNTQCNWQKFTTVWNSGGNSSMTFALVAVSISNAYALDNFSLTYKPKVVNFNPYTWSGPNGFKATTPTASVKLPKTPGTYPFKLIVSDGLCIDSTTVDVIVNCCDVEKPLISSNKPRICLGEPVTLTATGCDGQVFWSNGLTGPIVIYKPVLTDTLTARCKSLRGSCFGVNADSLRIVVNPIPPVPGITSPRTYVCAGIPLTLTATGCGTDGTAEWDDGSTGLTRSVTVPGTYWAKCVDNDCKSTQRNITITAGLCCSPPNIGITVSKSTLCDYESTVTLTASNCPAGGTITWSSVTGTVVPVASKNNNPLTMNFDATSNIQASCLYNSGNCTVSNTTTITKLGVVPPPTINPANPRICSTGSVQLTAIGCSGSVNWYKNDAGGNKVLLQSNSLSYIATVAQSYFTECVMPSGCKSGFGSAIVSSSNCCVLPTIAVSGSDRCGSGNNTLSSSGCSGTVRWYQKNTTNNTYTDLNSTGSSYTVIGLNLGTYTYAAECENSSGCFSGKQDVSFRVKSIPDAPVIETNDSYVCGTQTTTISVGSGCTNGSINWSNGATNTSLIIVGAGSYTATCNVDGCASGASNTITIQAGTCCTVIADPANVTTYRERCGSGTVEFNATCATGTPNWYNRSDGDASNVRGTGNSYTSDFLTARNGRYSYWVDCVTGAGCRSNKVEVEADIKISPNGSPTVSANTSSICAGGSVTLTASGCTAGDATGTITWTTGDGVNANNRNNNPLTVSPSGNTTYMARCTINGCDSGESGGVSVSITNVTADITGTSTVCVGGTINLTATGGTTYEWTTPSSGSLSGVSISITNAVNSNSGTYTVKAFQGSCFGTKDYQVEVINNPLINGSVNNESTTICAGGSTTLEANVTPDNYYGSIGYNWTKPGGGTETTQNITANGSGTYTISVTGTKSGQSCTTAKNIVVNVTTPLITDITVNGVYNVTANGSATVSLVATGCAGTVTWFANRGEGWFDIVTPRTTTVSESYNATCTISGCVSELTGLSRTATITNLPTAIISTPNSTAFCSGSSLLLTASCSSGTVTWRTAPNGSESSGNPYIVSSSGTYEAKCTVNGVSGAWSSITLNQDNTRSAPTISPTLSTTIPVTLTGGNCSNNTYILFKNGIYETVNNSPYQVNPFETAYYQVICTGSSCLSNVATVFGYINY